VKLQTKILLTVFMSATISGAFTVWFSKGIVETVVTQKMAQTGISQAVGLAESTADGFSAKDERLLLPPLQIAQRLSGAVYAAALDPAGVVLAHTNVTEKGRTYISSENLNLQLLNKPQFRIIRQGEESIMEVVAPAWRNDIQDPNEMLLLGNDHGGSRSRLGTIVLGLPVRDVLEIKTKIVRQVGILLLLIGGPALLITLWVMRGALYPIGSLLQGTEKISRGEYGIQVHATSNDELGELARSFNRMSFTLGETTVSKNFLSDILSHMIDPLIVMAMDSTIRMANQATLDLLGYSKEEIEGHRAHILFVAKDRSTEFTEQETLIVKGSVRNLELELVTKSGEKVPVLFSSSVLKDETGRPASIIAVAKDMTERRRLEKVIRQSEKMSAVGQLAAGVAHEINNPLGVILGFAQAVARRLAPNDPLELPLKSIEKEAVRCKNLVQDLLTFSRVSKTDREPLDINRAVEGALSLVNAQARMTHVKVCKELAPDLPRILGNLSQIQQVIINLANNALDAMGESGELTVRTEGLKEENLSWVRLIVADTGPGIPAEIQSRVFDPFFTTKPAGKGTGLGLSLVHEIVKKHSGAIDVQSRPGHTEFYIKFPVRAAGVSSAPPSAVPK
jgi:PAS domain S-box-containing protein